MIADAAAKIGLYAITETIPAGILTQMLGILNDMLDSWSNESLTCFAISEQTGALVAGKRVYTIGSGGDFNITRPIRLITGPGAAYLVDTNNNRYPVDVIPQDQWNLLWNLDSVTSNLPDRIFYDPQFPLGIINVYPMPNLPITLYFDSYLQLSEFAALSTPVSLPPGYKKAIQDNLALEFVPYFKSDSYQIPPHLALIASTSKANVKRSNIRINAAVFDKVLTHRGSSVWNIYSDTAR